MISLYHDGEIPSPWKEKMEAHLESCPECRAVLSEYGYLGEYLKGENLKGESLNDVSEETIKAAQERVWKKLTAPELIIPKAGTMQTKAKRRKWNITLPIPVAAAAVLVIIASLALVGISTFNRPPSQIPIVSADINLDDQGLVPVHDLQDMSGVIQFLSNQGIGDFMVIRLPESSKLSRSGEPVLINAADYSRRNVFR